MNKGKGLFAEGLSFYKVVAVFLVGSLVGTVYEEVLHLVREGYYENRSGVLYGPFNPLYGAGYVLMLYALKPFRRWYVALLAGALLGGAFEYAANLGQEFFTGRVSWDYEGRLLNINGRTTVPYSLFWGVLALFMVRGVYPPLSDIIERIPPRIGALLIGGLGVFILLNMFLSYTALIRQNLREEGVDPLTPYGEFLDEHYTRDRLKEAFPDMVVPEESP